MTSKDYELIASVISERQKEITLQNDYLTWWGLRDLAKAFAKKLAKDNPKFNEEKFMEACGY